MIKVYSCGEDAVHVGKYNYIFVMPCISTVHRAGYTQTPTSLRLNRRGMQQESQSML